MAHYRAFDRQVSSGQYFSPPHLWSSSAVPTNWKGRICSWCSLSDDRHEHSFNRRGYLSHLFRPFVCISRCWEILDLHWNYYLCIPGVRSGLHLNGKGLVGGGGGNRNRRETGEGVCVWMAVIITRIAWYMYENVKELLQHKLFKQPKFHSVNGLFSHSPCETSTFSSLKKQIDGGILDKIVHLKPRTALLSVGLIYCNTLRNTSLFSYPKQISIQGQNVEWRFMCTQKSRTGSHLLLMMSSRKNNQFYEKTSLVILMKLCYEIHHLSWDRCGYFGNGFNLLQHSWKLADNQIFSSLEDFYLCNCCSLFKWAFCDPASSEFSLNRFQTSTVAMLQSETEEAVGSQKRGNVIDNWAFWTASHF